MTGERGRRHHSPGRGTDRIGATNGYHVLVGIAFLAFLPQVAAGGMALSTGALSCPGGARAVCIATNVRTDQYTLTGVSLTLRDAAGTEVVALPPSKLPVRQTKEIAGPITPEGTAGSAAPLYRCELRSAAGGHSSVRLTLMILDANNRIIGNVAGRNED